MDKINRAIKMEETNILDLCISEGFPILGKILDAIIVKTKQIRVMLLCNWCSSQELVSLWSKMSQNSSSLRSSGSPSWNNIILVWKEPADYWVIINSPPKNALTFDKKRTILFRMEPNMHKYPQQWGEWADPIDTDFLYVARHETGFYNNCEWHINKSYSYLNNPINTIPKIHDKILSTVLSSKYKDIGQVKRTDFVKFLEKKEYPVHVFGDNKWDWKEYKGSLPYHCKDDALFPYKYTFNCENQSIKNYFTEKLIDGILSECLTFYSGCSNIREYIDERAYVYLDLSNFEHNYQIIKKAMEEDWHTQRLPFIREAKKKILNEMQFFPRIEKILEMKK